MVYVLLVFVLAIGLVIFFLTNQDLTSPTVLTCIVIGITVGFSVLNSGSWGSFLSVKTMIVVLTGLLAFASGEVFIRMRTVRNGSGLPKAMSHMPQKPVCISVFMVVIVCLVLLCMAVYYFMDIFSIAKQAGYSSSAPQKMLWYARRGMTGLDLSTNRLSSHFFHFSHAFFLFFSSCFLYNVIFFKFNFYRDILLLLPIVPTILIAIFSTSRTNFISYACYLLVLSLLFFKMKSNNQYLWVKFIIAGLCTFLVYLIVFIALGVLGGRAAVNDSFKLISLYTGFSLPTLDGMIRNGWESSPFWLQYSFPSIHHVLSKLNILPPNLPPLQQYFYHLQEASGNVYTVFRVLLLDFGFLGVPLGMFSFSCFYSVIYTGTQNKYGVNICHFLYAFLSYSILMQGIEMQLLNNFFSTTTVYIVIYVSFAYFICIFVPTTVRKKATY